ncbi:PaaI family thioesterase [Rhodobacter sp. CZR27]|uniref:PaaI family thioesterase n=1 Tax=Rhodobacter sp. CZR27 TaxID=2033869 RepID=UPI000BBE8CBF|nr:PaaI family thioesterase [Rhodobacter sp. CZR27]
MGLILDAAELEAFLAREFPQVAEDFAVVACGDELVMRLKVGPHHLRPGGTVSGPSMFALADVAMYLAILARIGPVALAVTTNISMDFMRKPESGRDLIGHARLLKLGRILAVGDVLIRSDGSDEVVARAGLTYSIPPSRSAGLP